jgi:hypothetical protein
MTDELPRAAKEWLAIAADAEQPPEGARESVRRRIALAIAPSAGPNPPNTSRLGGEGHAQGGSLYSKLLVTAAVAALGAAAWTLHSWGAVQQPHAEDEASAPLRAAEPPSAPNLSAQPVAVQVEPRAPSERHSQPHSVSARVPAPAAVRGAGSGTDLAAQLALLSQASRALAEADVRRARDLLRQHEKLYRASPLREERNGLKVLASCLDHDPEAAPRAARYLRDTPHGVLDTRIRQACSGLTR